MLTHALKFETNWSYPSFIFWSFFNFKKVNKVSKFEQKKKKGIHAGGDVA